ncbi:3-oxo-5-alpha-steroid 4-dehydrogenase-domain-containing protein [Microdochium trichocladiopsis]|uniref:3-oxo-5-alpha-steroid 4-dehydrogenase-domain-containing protein n=1 Tax=Microdochium trichocladiopsis TaxID=1682393 RepID=A0A9P9BTE9_9PEZI|nr:3-oxo-5-alpha-steroid 4-dehydrogenase-domain-containing protein [Microdochium trichocladiopsis]KAH7039911.1 3-oxo-5-alpha-steroid 4-dehydrogenase-domain-containing protein [Microdochium trichocladiopsis]
MAIVQNWLPPSEDNYNFIMFWWSLFPLFGSLQWVVSFDGMGKGSIAKSMFNIPGKLAWLTMEVPGATVLLYTIRALTAARGASPEDLPWQNKVLAGLFVTHYAYRAIIYPLVAPSMSDIHVFVWLSAASFQVCNGTCIGAWLAAYGPTTQAEWAASGFSTARFAAGLLLFSAGLAANYFSDEELREIRRSEQRRQERLKKSQGGKGGGTIHRHYELPNNGLFRYILYPHYFFEWVEWLGYWVAGGFAFAPARAFLLNEIFSMLPRAVKGGEWYRQKFGAEKVNKKWIIIPGIY